MRSDAKKRFWIGVMYYYRDFPIEVFQRLVRQALTDSELRNTPRRWRLCWTADQWSEIEKEDAWQMTVLRFGFDQPDGQPRSLHQVALMTGAYERSSQGSGQVRRKVAWLISQIMQALCNEVYGLRNAELKELWTEDSYVIDEWQETVRRCKQTHRKLPL